MRDSELQFIWLHFVVPFLSTIVCNWERLKAYKGAVFNEVSGSQWKSGKISREKSDFFYFFFIISVLHLLREISWYATDFLQIKKIF